MAEEKEADETDIAEGEDGEGAPKKSKKKLLLFIVLPVVIVLLGGVAGAILFLGGSKDKKGAVDEHGNPVEVADAGHGAKDEGHGKAKDGHGGDHDSAPLFYKLPPIIANISGEKPGEQMLLSVEMQLEIPDEETRHKLDELLPRVIDRYQSFLSELRVEDIKGSAGNYRLRLELLRRVNLAVQPAHVNDVLIEKLVVN